MPRISRDNKGRFIKGNQIRLGSKLNKKSKHKMSIAKIGKIPWNKGKKTKPETIEKLKKSHIGIQSGKNHPMYGKKHTIEAKQIMRSKKLGHIPWNKGLLGFCSGSKNSNWKGGITPKTIEIRQSTESRNWKKAVLSRDNYTCIKCRIRSGKLHIHHIENFSQNIEKRFDINNGITLCEKDHKLFHKIYGKINNNQKQIEDFTGIRETSI